MTGSEFFNNLRFPEKGLNGSTHAFTHRFRWERLAHIGTVSSVSKYPNPKLGSLLAQLTSAAAWQRYAAFNR
jgi:hypothetical protein